MFAKVAFVCTIMVVVQSRVELYGSAIIASISTKPCIQDKQVLLSDGQRYEPSEAISDEMVYSIYDWGSEMLQYLCQKIKLSELIGDTPKSASHVVNTEMPSLAYNAGAHDGDTTKYKDITSDITFLKDTAVEPPVDRGNGSVANSGFRNISDWNLASDLFGRGTSGIVAVGYEN